MIEAIQQFIMEFLNKFIGAPSGGGGGIVWSLNHMIRCESVHFLLSGFSGLLVLSLLISTTSSELERPLTKLGRATYLYFFSLSYCVSVCVHIGIDAFSTLA